MLGRVPSGEMIDSTRHEPKVRTAEVIHSDMSWRRVSVLAWAVHRNGWAVLIRWPDGREDWREYDGRHIRPALGRVSHTRALGRTGGAPAEGAGHDRARGPVLLLSVC
jgi:hypothetical protein